MKHIIRETKKLYAHEIVEKMPKALCTDTPMGKSMEKDLNKLRLSTLNNLHFIIVHKNKK